MKFTIPSFVQELVERFQKKGFEIYIVGGAVRDLLMERDVTDWDFTTNATPEQILELFAGAFYDNKFGTVGIPVEKTQILEVTTFRREETYSDRRHPDKVVWGESLEEDLARRDFTINAMAFKIAHGLQTTVDIQIIDPFHGQEDLKNKLIRAVGNPQERFREDALRMMRAVRIASELGFVIEEKTFEAIKMNVPLIRKISAERIRDELFKLLASPYQYEGIVMLRNAGLLVEILPEVEEAFDIPQKSPKRHHVVDVGTHLLYSLRYCPSKDSLVRLAALLHDIGKPQTFKKDEKTGVITFYNHEVVGGRIANQVANRLRLSKKEIDKLFRLVRWHLFTVDERQTDSALRRFIRNVGVENLEDILAVRTGDRLGGGATETSWRLELFKKRLLEVQKQPFSVQDLKINGNDVMKELGITSGPKVGQVLNALFAEVEEGKLKNNREDLLKRMEEIGKEF
ncbi:CCA tRNA nucleotidyltransferase [Candidatus Microgenomates bacterium]|nr:CCA tRNA nucleotidyltransferase [Candidatus Microgenomates bacterium]